jgi:hypothetical protein
MNDEPGKKNNQSLDQRFANDPLMRQRLLQIADMRDELLAQGASLDEIEERTVQQIRLLGQELLQSVAQERVQAITTKVQKEQAGTIKHRKKK